MKALSAVPVALTASDIPEANALLGRAFGAAPVFARRLTRYLALSPATWLALRRAEDAALLGMVGANVFEGCAYIGLMAVEPASQHHGHGGLLMSTLIERLRLAGVHTLLLDASAEGAPLYARLGFAEAGEAQEWVTDGSVAASLPSARGEIREESDEAPRAAVALDASLFGTDRRRLWQRLGEEARSQPGSVRFLVSRAPTGEVDGYLALQAGILAGPFGARTPLAASALLNAALGVSSFRASGRVLVPSDNTHAPALLSAAGFRRVRALKHMRLAWPEAPLWRPLPSWSQLYGKASFCLG